MPGVSDWLQFVVDERIGVEDASGRSTQLCKKLVSEGWIVAAADPKCALGAKGHRPGPEVRSWYVRGKGEGDFTTLKTNGVVIEAGPFTNLAAGPFEMDLLICPKCEAPVDEERVMEFVGRWMSGETAAALGCEACGGSTHLRSLRSADGRESPVVCGNLTLTFYNWPPLDRAGWKKDIIEVIAGVLGSRPSLARAKL
jgi:hypothetical protein